MDLTPQTSNFGACVNTSKNTIRSALSFPSAGHCARQKFLGVVVMRSVPSDVEVELRFRRRAMATLTKNADMALEQSETRRILSRA